MSGPYFDGGFGGGFSGDDEPGSGAAERGEDLLELGRDGPGPLARLVQHRPWLRPAAAIGAAGLIAAGIVLGSHSGSHEPDVTSPRPTHLATNPPPPVSHARPTFADTALAATRALAGQRGRLPDYVRQDSPAGACALVPPGRSVKETMTAAVERAAPGFRVQGFGMVLDEFTELCAVQLRARDAAGDVLVVSAESPGRRHPHTRFSRLQSGFEVSPHSVTKYATITTPAGFTVLVGATGRMRRLPSDRLLSSLAHDRALTW